MFLPYLPHLFSDFRKNLYKSSESNAVTYFLMYVKISLCKAALSFRAQIKLNSCMYREVLHHFETTECMLHHRVYNCQTVISCRS